MWSTSFKMWRILFLFLVIVFCFLPLPWKIDILFITLAFSTLLIYSAIETHDRQMKMGFKHVLGDDRNREYITEVAKDAWKFFDKSN